MGAQKRYQKVNDWVRNIMNLFCCKTRKIFHVTIITSVWLYYYSIQIRIMHRIIMIHTVSKASRNWDSETRFPYDSLALHNMTLLIITAREGEEALHVVFLNFERGLSFRGLSFRGLTFRGLTLRGLSFRGLSFRGLSFRGLSFRDTLSNYNCQGRWGGFTRCIFEFRTGS